MWYVQQPYFCESHAIYNSTMARRTSIAYVRAIAIFIAILTQLDSSHTRTIHWPWPSNTISPALSALNPRELIWIAFSPVKYTDKPGWLAGRLGEEGSHTQANCLGLHTHRDWHMATYSSMRLVIGGHTDRESPPLWLVTDTDRLGNSCCQPDYLPHSADGHFSLVFKFGVHYGKCSSVLCILSNVDN